MTSLESKVASLVDVENALSFARGSSGLYELFTAIARKSGVGEVIIPTLCCETVALSAIYAGHKVVFADVSPNSFCITPDTLEPLLSIGTRAVVVVHLFGMDAKVEGFEHLRSKFPSVVFIEDIAHSFGGLDRNDNMLGAGLDVALVSFAQSKIIPGNGGMLVADQFFFDKYELSNSRSEIASDQSGNMRHTRREESLRNIVHALADIWRDSNGVWSGSIFNQMAHEYRSVVVRAGGVEDERSAKSSLENISNIRKNRYDNYLKYKKGIGSKSAWIPTFHRNSNCWRCPVVFKSSSQAKVATDLLRSKGIPASNHYFPLSVLFDAPDCRIGEDVALRILNLWVSEEITDRVVDQTAEIINGI